MNISGISNNTNAMSLYGSSKSSSVKSGASSSKGSISDQMASLREQMNALAKNDKLTDEERKEESKKLSDKMSELMENFKSSVSSGSTSSLISNIGVSKKSSSGGSSLNSTLESLAAISGSNAFKQSSARGMRILENEQRTLESEIKLDSSRGITSSRKQERLDSVKERLETISYEVTLSDDYNNYKDSLNSSGNSDDASSDKKSGASASSMRKPWESVERNAPKITTYKSAKSLEEPNAS